MLKENYHRKKMSQLTYAPVEYNYMETLAKTYIIPARQNHFFQENIFNNAPIRQTAIAMNSKSAFTGFFAENPFWYKQFNLRDIRILRGGQPTVHHDTAANCRLYVATRNALNFQDDIPSVPVDNFKDHYVLVFDLTSMQDATEHCHYPELIGEPLRLELNFSSLQKMSQKSLYWVNVCLVLQSTSLVLWEESVRWITLPLSKLLTVYLCSSIGTWDGFPQTFFQTFRMTRLRLSTHSPATRLQSTR